MPVPKFAALIGLLTVSTVTAASLTVPVPFQGQVPARWTQRPLASAAQGAVLTAPDRQAALVVTAAPLGRQVSPQELREYIAGVEKTASGNGAATLKLLSERPRTVGGIRGTERVSLFTLKASNTTLNLRSWYGAGPRYVYQFQLTSQRGAPATLTGAYDQFLKTVRFK